MLFRSAAFDEAFLELAAQGQATFVSAGDEAAYDEIMTRWKKGSMPASFAVMGHD